MAIINLDIQQFKSEYIKLRDDYGAKQIPIINVEIVDEIDIWDYMLLRPYRRLRFGAKLANQAKASSRPTEELALARAYGFPILDEDFLVPTQSPRDEQKWYCAVCERKYPIQQFASQATIDAFNAGHKLAAAIGYCCAECKRERAKAYWKRAA